MKWVPGMDTNLRIIAALILIMLCVACWFWIRPTRSALDSGENRAEQTDRRNS
jgi:hypothetical protein